MNKLFSLDSPLFRFLEKVADFFIVNALFALCSLPVITAGAALTAAFKVMQNMVMDNEQPIVKSFFKTFKNDFKQSTLLWLIVLGVLAFLIFDLLVVYFNLQGSIALVLYVFLGVCSVVTLGSAVFSFQMIARYENPLKQHLRNGFFLAIGNLPRTVVILAVLAIPFFFLFVNPTFFFNILPFWAIMGMSILFYNATRLLRPIFLKLEEVPEEEEAAEEESEEETES